MSARALRLLCQQPVCVCRASCMARAVVHHEGGVADGTQASCAERRAAVAPRTAQPEEEVCTRYT
eukprot:2042203-Prymnesium_polylepis.2